MNNNDHSNNSNDSDNNANHNDINTLTTFFFPLNPAICFIILRD